MMIIIMNDISFPLQYYKPEGIPAKNLNSDVCALCGNQFLVKVGQEGVVENTYRLTCAHEYVPYINVQNVATKYTR